MPEAVADLGRDLDDFGAVGHGVHQLESPLVQLQRDVLLPRVARVDAEDYPLKKDGRRKILREELAVLSHPGHACICNAILSGNARE